MCFDSDMENNRGSSKLLELAATDDLPGFIHQVEQMGSDVNEAKLWYCRSFSSNKMGFQSRTPLMIASLYGSTKVLNYIIHTHKVDVNKACASDGATALHCAAACSCLEVVKLLIAAGGDINRADSNGKKPSNLIAPSIKSSKKNLQMTPNGAAVCLPDINDGVYGSDEFRMYSFKVKPCSRAYTHDWTECPFVHPGENARRRDPTKFNYSCVPCPEFKKGSCGKGDGCEFAHGVFESWLHPAQYKTRLCKDEIGCSRKVCFFAHKPQELRPLFASIGSALPSEIRRNLNRVEASSAAALWKRSQSFVAVDPSRLMVSKFSDWRAPDGKLDWGFNAEDAVKLRKSVSFGFRAMQRHEMRMYGDQEQMVA